MSRSWGVAALLVWASTALAGDPWRAAWIWDDPRASRTAMPTDVAVHFRYSFELPARLTQGHTIICADDAFRLYINGKEVAFGGGWWPPTEMDISEHLGPGRNVIAIRMTNKGGPAGLYFECNGKSRTGELINIVSGGDWRTSRTPGENWYGTDYPDADWKPAVVLGKMGIKPWGHHEKPAASARPVINKPLPAAESIKHFTLTPGFELRIVAEEPDVINPVAMALDEKGRIYVAESHTYRWGKEGSPVRPHTNPVVMLEVGEDGRARRKHVVVDGFEDPVMGIAIRDGKMWITALNEVIVAPLHEDGTIGERKVIVRDKARPWNPFGFYRIHFGPDGWLYLIVGDHEIELTGSDGTVVKTRGSTGALFRMRPDGSQLQLLCQGMRAPFSFDFDPFGRIWVLSNGEGNPNRLLLMIQGLDYHFQTRHGDWGWLAGTHPWSPPVTEMERGANTQVLCYLDSAYPERYWGKLFVANWGAHGFASVNHKIDIYTPDARGNITDVSVFLDSADPMFRPTQLLPDRDGNLLMLDWYGRDDENDLTGRIYRIVYTGDEKPRAPIASHVDGEVAQLWSTSSSAREAADRRLACVGTKVAIDPGLDPFAVTQQVWFHQRNVRPSEERGDWVQTREDGSLRVRVRFDGPTSREIARVLLSPEPRIRAMAVRLLREQGATVTYEPADSDPEVAVECALSQRESGAIVEGLLDALRCGARYDRRLRYQCAAELSRRMTADQFRELTADEWKDAGWIALDVALLENVNSAVHEAFASLLADPSRADGALELAQRWLRPEHAEPLRTLLTIELAGNGSARRIASAFGLLQRLGPDAMSELPSDAIGRFFEAILAGKLELPKPADRLGALQLTQNGDIGASGAKFVQRCLSDGDAGVRLAALRTVRLIGWEHPELFEAVWRFIQRPKCPEDEKLAAIVTLGAEESPDAARWKELVSGSGPIARQALRTCKQFVGNEAIRDMLAATAPEQIARDERMRGEWVSVLSLFELTDAQRAELKLSAVQRPEPEKLQEQMLTALPMANPRLGQDVYERLGCLTCHDIAGTTQTFGPSLHGIGKANTPAYIAESILWPSRTIKDGFESQIVRTRSGQELEGWVERSETELIVVRNGSERVRVPLEDVAEQKKLSNSPMPEINLDGVSLDELADLLAYLVSQGGDPKAAQAAR